METIGSSLIRPKTFKLAQVAHIFIKDTTKYSRVTIDELPFRTKMDRAIRRLKYTDIEKQISPDTREAINWMGHMDQIWATNLLIWTEMHGLSAFMEMKSHGFFNDLQTFIEMTSTLSSWVKRFDITNTESKQKFAEMNTLAGYMNSDLVQTDWRAELKSLAHGGAHHGLVGSDWKRDFLVSNAQIKLPAIQNTRPDYIGFKDYIASGRWLTAGSSSEGVVKWEAAGEKGSFKARKNMLSYVYTTDELYDMCVHWDGVSRNKAFTKDELSKRRLAVASNVEGYLYESYFLALYGHPYKNWKYITLDESAGESHNRTAFVSKLLKDGAYALPFDFKGFDHQPTTWEILAMIKSNLYEVQVPKSADVEWGYIRAKILHSYARSEIMMRIDNKHVVETVTGGLPSGVRLTSLIGNQWNAIVTNIVLNYASEITKENPLAVGIRGDDTYIIHQSPVYLGIVREMYRAVNAIGLDSKFGICYGVCEFLRNEISKHGQRGWSNRSIPSITQRKPWNASPWGIETQVKTTHDNIATIERRIGKELLFLHTANKIKWSRYFKQTYKWLELPTRLGGLGVYPDKGWRPGRKLSLARPKSVHFVNTIPTQPPWIDLTTTQAKIFSNLQMNKLLATDDIVHVSKFTNDGLLLSMRKFKTEWKLDSVDRSYLSGLNIPTPITPETWPRSIQPIKEVWNGFTFMEVLSSSQSVATATDTTVQDILSARFPITWYKIKNLEKQGWHRTDAINIIAGGHPITSLFRIHPVLAAFISEACSRKMKYIHGRTNIANMLYAYTWSGEQQMEEKGALLTYGY